LRVAAERDHRIANMIEVMIHDHCERNGITIPERQPLPLGDEDDQKSF
jgi:hypothetical protein